jgi:hypothetical protein
MDEAMALAADLKTIIRPHLDLQLAIAVFDVC